MDKTIIEDWCYHPGFGEDTRLISKIRYNSKGEPVECTSLRREYRLHTIVGLEVE